MNKMDYKLQDEELKSEPQQKGEYLREADTRAKIIDPLLHKSGWTEDLITREYPISVGRIEIVGEIYRRMPPKKADYVLRISPFGSALAVIEAKSEEKPATAGIQKAKDYAKKLGVLFAYACSGQTIEEFDFTTNRQTTLFEFPTPKELRERFFKAKLAEIAQSPKAKEVFLESYCHTPNLSSRYYQEAAVQASLEAIIKNRKRLLLTLATGTGKTVIAFNIVWRLVKSGYLKRVLFIADRNFLRDQAYNTFAPFGEARANIPDRYGNLPKHQDIYFSIYQALYSPSSTGKRIYQEYPPDFFDLIIIDECHRSGWGRWYEILQHFNKAIHLGMTATPKREDNIDTYAYFGEPVYTYSFGQGVDDGYLAPFIVHRILTNIDKEGKLTLEEAKSQGAEIIYAAEEEIKPEYSQNEFEKTITIPERTKQIAKHLAKILRNFDPMAKTMVFCVDSDHAELMAKELQNEFADLGFDNFAVPIISRTGDIIEADYERFRDSYKETPVIATTVDLLTTGVDVPSVRNIVIVKPVASKIVFKQIIGRGSRLDPVTDKNFFRIIDYIGATRLFDEWELPPPPPKTEKEGPTNFFLSGFVVDAETQEPIPYVNVVLQRGPNQQLYQNTQKDGRFEFSDLPHKKFQLTFKAADYKTRSLSLPTQSNSKEAVIIELTPEKLIARRKVIVKNLPVFIAQEEKLILEKTGKMLNQEEYIEYAGREVVKRAAKISQLREIWLDPDKRHEFLEDLASKSIYPEIISELLKKPEVDSFDLIAHVAFGSIPLTRDERIEALRNREQQFLSAFSENAKEIIFALLEKYRLAGIEEIENPKVFELPPFDRMGKIYGVVKIFGDTENLRQTINNLRGMIYA